MTVRRLQDIPGFNIDRVAAAAGDDPDILLMVRFVFSNEPIERLAMLGERVSAALAAAGA